MSEIGDLYVVLRAITAPFKKSMAEAATVGEASSTRIGGALQRLAKVGIVAGTAAIAIGGITVHWADEFQTQMTRLYTAAGLTNKQLQSVHMTSGQLNDAVLKLGNQVGMTGTQMAEALYHPISAGLDLKSSLETVKFAAEEAQISGASLDDTTYSLSSVMKAFNFSAADAGPTMASLNAIVGEGDMRFQDFNESIKNWAPTAAQMGISVNSMGAGLAYLTDRGNSAEVAATRMTMGISMMTTPSQKATKMLVALGVASTDVKASSKAMQAAMKKAGITQNQLALDLKKPDGLYVALHDLKSSLEKAGVSGTEADSVLAKIFGGGRSDKAIMSLMQNLDGLKDKYDAISHDSSPKKFATAWETTQKTFHVQVKKTEASLVNLGIRIGTILLPYVQRFLGWIQKGVSWLSQHKQAVMILAGALGTALVAAIAAVGLALAAAIGPEELIAAGIMALGAGLVYAYKHFSRFRTIVKQTGAFLKTVFVGAVHLTQAAIKALVSWWKQHQKEFSAAWQVVYKKIQSLSHWFKKNVIEWLQGVIGDMVTWWHQNSDEIHQAWVRLWHALKIVAKIWWDDFMKPHLKVIKAAFKTAWDAIRDAVELAWGVITSVISMAIHAIENIIVIFADIITGRWSKLWHDLLHLVSQALNDAINVLISLTTGFGTLLWDAGVNVIKGLIGGIRSMIGGVGNAMSDVTQTIKDHLPWSPAKKGPLSGSGAPEIGGRNIGRLIARGLGASVIDVRAATARVAGAASLSVSGTGVGALSVGQGVTALTSGGNGPLVVKIGARTLFEILQTEALRYGRRNPTTGLTYA